MRYSTTMALDVAKSVLAWAELRALASRHRDWSDLMKGKPGIPFLVMGVAFLAIGASGQRVFLGIGAAFLAIGVAFLLRQKRAGGSK